MDDKMSEPPEKRRNFRIVYPTTSIRPTLKIRKHTFEIVDISEKGIKFIADKKVKFGRWVTGEVTFYDAQTVNIEGKIAWQQGENIGMFLTIKSIPYPRILSEQRLLSRFK